MPYGSLRPHVTPFPPFPKKRFNLCCISFPILGNAILMRIFSILERVKRNHFLHYHYRFTDYATDSSLLHAGVRLQHMSPDGYLSRFLVMPHTYPLQIVTYFLTCQIF